MNKKLIAFALTIALIGTGCAVKESSDNTPNTETGPDSPVEITGSDNSDQTDKDSSENESSQDTSAEQSDADAENALFIETAIEMLGLTSDETADYFGGSETLYSADGVYFIGRTYQVSAFGIDTTLNTSVDDKGIVNSINAHLGEDNFDAMKAYIEKRLGEPDAVTETPSEAGYTNVMWDVAGRLVYLYKGYGTVDLQLILPYQPSSSIIDSNLESVLPDSITPVLAESAPHPLLRDFIIETFEIPESYYANTKYYYNYVDLNGDGKDEIFALVMGPYTSGTGGSSALIAFEFEGELRPIQKMTLINTPVIISDSATRGMKEIIVLRSGGGATSAYVKLTSSHAEYQTLSQGEALDSLEGISGRAIIANDLMHDIENGSYLTLE